MCGLVGVISKWSSGLSATEVKVFINLLYMDVLRGEDATGVCRVAKNGDALVMKDEGPAYYYLMDGEVQSNIFKDATNSLSLLGHNRKATVGLKTKHQAHPFVIEDRYVFFHNGTLTNHKKIADTEVDSEALGILLTKCEGDPDKIAEALSSVYGAYAVVWYDTHTNKVYFLRNSQRTLFYTLTQGGLFAYASEEFMLKAALDRNSLTTTTATIKPFLPGHLYTIDLASSSDFFKEVELKKVTPQSSHTPILTGGKNSTGSKYKELTYNEGKKLIKRIRNETHLGVEFYIDDVTALATTDSLDPGQCYDWYVTGTCDNYDGAYFSVVVKSKFPREMTSWSVNSKIVGNVEDISWEHSAKKVFVQVKDFKLAKYAYN